MNTKEELGQYFTTNLALKNTIFNFILNRPNVILEPSVGRGDLVEFITEKIPEVKFDMYEIDSSIELLNTINKELINFCDFLCQDIQKKYVTIIGNPPYVKCHGKNLYIRFIEKCFNLLDDDGELIFIVPSAFFKLTNASPLLIKMLNCGSFTHIFHPNNERLFEGASIDIIIFRYCNNKELAKKVLYNNEEMFIMNSNGMLTFSKEQKREGNKMEDIFNIYVGMVSGKDAIYKNDELGNTTLLNDENDFRKYIYIKNFPCDDEKINQYMLEHKGELISRKIRKFNERNWFEWGALRNIKTIEKYIGRTCIYVRNMTRKKKVAFIDKVTYFGGKLIILIPKEETLDMISIVNYLNSEAFMTNFIFSGRFKIGQRQLCNC